jgi:hypothetical protein
MDFYITRITELAEDDERNGTGDQKDCARTDGHAGEVLAIGSRVNNIELFHQHGSDSPFVNFQLHTVVTVLMDLVVRGPD